MRRISGLGTCGGGGYLTILQILGLGAAVQPRHEDSMLFRHDIESARSNDFLREKKN